MATRRRRTVTLGVTGVAVVVLLAAFLGPYVYIHFIEGPAPSKLELPTTPPTPSSTTAGSATSTPWSLDGTWNVGAGSMAGYRVQEVLLGQSATAVGRTSKIWGSLTITGATVMKGAFTVNLASVVSDQSQRNARFEGPIMDVSQYPTATLSLTSPINLGAIPADRVVAH
jgi:polyisoprenoid-binding protein YceI